MASETLAISTSYHKPVPSCRKSKLETTKVRSEDELLKFFLHGSYDVQRGHMNTCQVEENNDKILCIKDEITNISNLNIDDKKAKSRCMFEETYMINISVKQPDTTPSSKQIDVRIEKAPSDIPITNEKIDDVDDDDEISSIFDEEENDEVDSVIFNDMNSSASETPSTKLTLADMINKTLTTIPTTSCENLNKLNKNNNWFIEQQNEKKTRPTNEHIIPSTKTVEQVIKTPPSPPAPNSLPSIIQTSTLTTNINEDKKLFEYLDYLETKDDTNQPIQSSTIPTKISKPTPSTSKVPLKQYQQEPIPIIDLEQLCRSLTVSDLKDEYIRKKIFELKILIDERHKKHKNQIPLVKPRKDNLPILIAMPPTVQQQRRRPNVIQPTTLLQSKTVNLQVPYNPNYHDMVSNFTTKPSSSSNNQHYTRHQTPSTKYKV
ncbi:unnamed protein product [Rotaria sp. Silwood1]|nr:unnamed protein product [Rotaria sp. Silwood1]CAF0958508.1 unnamed protein product [Rotaria sp. Silwood1]CAF3374558.1 unnamed protein product [Rotaria sp. Silwood1]CAF3379655.1 unnamed protein product [Rotaria sp. Silwood1]CAF4521651.1 unnamed protein product [Rotaria sp. Silwood1]